MEPMGYRNIQLVDGIIREGRIVHKSGKVMTLDPMQALMLYKLAWITADYPLDEKAKEKGRMPRTYSYGWLALAQDLGMTLPAPGDQLDVIAEEPRNPKRELIAMQRISRTAKNLEDAGFLKCLRKGSAQRRNNAVWLLTIGTPEENAEVERYVRAHMYI